MLTWVVGSGGLLGGAVAQSMDRTFLGSPVPWTDPVRAVTVLGDDLSRFVREAGPDDWSLVWAAGSGVLASTESELRAETSVLEGFLARVGHEHPEGRGVFFLASSAGGVYAGSRNPPFDESTTPRPLSAYGRARLAQEELAARMLATEVPLLIGRLSNLFGPGQNVAKPQGLVSQLCLAAATRRALNLYVPMETLRDYLYIDDASAMIRSFIAAEVRRRSPTPVLRNLASERPTPVASVVRTVQQVAHRPIRFALRSAPTARYQVRDLRIVSRVPYDSPRPQITPLPVGIKRVYEHTLRVLSGSGAMTTRS